MIKKIFKNGNYIVEMHTYSPGLNPLPLYAPVRFRHDSHSPPTCIRTLWMAPNLK